MLLKNVSQKLIGNKIFWLLVLLLVVSLVYLNQFTLDIKDPILTNAEGHQTKIFLPYTKEMPATEYVISGKIDYNRLLSVNTVHIIPDDELLSIRVNHQDVSVSEEEPGFLSDSFQGFHFNLGRYLQKSGESEQGQKYWQAGLTVLNTLLDEPYLSTDENHQGLILHSLYHRPNGWDYIPAGQSVPCGEATMWGDYHAREVALYVQRIINGENYLTFWGNSERTTQV